MRCPVAGASTAAMFNEKVKVDPLFLGGMLALRIMDVFSKHSPLIPVQTKNPEEVRDVFRTSRIGIFGPPMSIQMDEGGEWKHEFRLMN